MLKKGLLWLCLLLLPVYALAESFTGTWEGEDSLLVLDPEGRGSWTVSDSETEVRVEQNRLYAGATLLGTLRLEDSFLVLTDPKGESWPLMQKADALPGKTRPADAGAYLGRWNADFALVSGFRIPLGEEETPVQAVYEIDEETVTFSGTGYETPVTLPVHFAEDGSLQVLLGDETWTLWLLEDDSLIRETEVMTLHLVREQAIEPTEEEEEKP